MNSARQDLFLLSLASLDRPGLLDAVAKAIADLQGSWLESRMLRLEGHFTGLLRVSLPHDQRENLDAALQKIEGLQSQLFALVTREDDADVQSQDQRATLELTSYDRPGLVRKVSRLLKRHDVDIETFESELRRAAMSGDPTFYARVHLSIPKGNSIDELTRALERLGSDLMVDLQLDS